MSVINGIDYDDLARRAETSRVPFHILCKRAEKGQPIENTLSPDPDWVDYHDAAKIVGCRYHTLAGTLTDPTVEIEYWGIKWKSRSKVNPKSKRGCGVLFYKPDLVVIANIRKYAHLSIKSALKVFQAMEGGHI